jgi:glutamyl-tRNA reductase
VTGAISASAQPVVLGFGHRSSPATLRDQLFVADAEMGGFLAELRAAGLGQAIALSTCDRVEIQGAAADPGGFVQAVLKLFAVRSGASAEELGRHAHFLSGADALKHIFAVAASLDSQIIGEPQVLGQVKEAHRLSRDAGLLGPELDAILQAAFGAAKRVRSKTALGERPVTLASAAIQVARDVHGDLSGCTGLLIGPGDMGELLVEHFRTAGLKQLAVAGPNLARTEAMARTLGSHIASFDTLEATLAAADVVIAALGTGRHSITVPLVEEALRRRRRRAMLFLDLGVPADIDPAVEPLDGAFRYDLDDLERAAMSGRVSRDAAAAEAWAILDAELAAFSRDRAGRNAAPAISALRRHFERERERVLLEAGGDPARATELLVNRLLHEPSQTLRRLASSSDPATRAEAEKLLYDLFALSPDGTARDEGKK